jgi:adenylate kinase family enzyme
MARIHILGAPGSGTSTLGAALAARLGVSHTDADSVYWLPTDPPFTTPRSPEAREALLQHMLPADGDWVFSGAATQCLTTREPSLDLVVFLRLDPAIRMARLLQRETSRWGPRILPGGDMAAIHAAFIARASAYDTAGSSRYSLTTHEAWLADQTNPILRLGSRMPVTDLVATVTDHLGAADRATRRSKTWLTSLSRAPVSAA